MFTEGGVCGHDGGSENSKSDLISWPDTVRLDLKNGGKPRSYGISAPRTVGIHDNKKMEQAEE